jgi:peptide/nickel transport system permease protein
MSGAVDDTSFFTLLAPLRASLALVWRVPRARMGLLLLGAFTLLALIGPLFLGDPDALVARPLQPPSWAHWLGTSGQGQDVLAQTIMGTRRSLAIGFGVGVAVVVLGALIGIVAATVSGVVDTALSSLTQIVLVLPGLPLAIVIAAYLPSGPLTVVLVLVLTGWAWNARVVRSQALTLRSRDFVAAARVAGDSRWGIMATAILPNLSSLLFSQLVGSVTYAIGAEVGLGFLGLGDVSVVTWGTNLYWATNDGALLTGAWWTFVPSGLCIALVGYALVLLSSGLDEVSNPRLRSHAPFVRFVTAGGGVVGQATPVVRRGGR